MEPMKLHEIGLGEGESYVLSYHHFRFMLGLCGEGLDPWKCGIDEYAIKVECIKLWGPKKGHNKLKFKVDGKPLELEAKIRHLNNVIYQKGQSNIMIYLAFAKRIIANSKGMKMN